MKPIIPLLALTLSLSLIGCAPDSMQIISKAWNSNRTWTPISWPSIPGCEQNSPSMPCMVPTTTVAKKNWDRSKTRNSATDSDKNWGKMTSKQHRAYRAKAKTEKATKLENRISQLPQLSHNAPAWLETYGALQRAKSDLPNHLYQQLTAEMQEK